LRLPPRLLVNVATGVRRIAWLAEDVQRHSYDGRIVPILTCPGASLQHIAAAERRAASERNDMKTTRERGGELMAIGAVLRNATSSSAVNLPRVEDGS